MKHIVTTLAFALLTIVGWAQKPNISFEETQFDFGEIKEADGPVTHRFTFTNKGNTPLVLHNVQASCGCTTPSWPRTPIQPNATSQIDVTFNPANRPGTFSKTITVTSNASNAQVTLRISGKVMEAEKTIEQLYPTVFGEMRLQDSYIPFTKIIPGETKMAELKVINPSSEWITPEFLNVPSHIHIACVPATLAPGQEGLIQATYDAVMKNDWGYVSDQVYVTFNGVRSYSNRITISATIQEDFTRMTDEEKANAPKLEFDSQSHDWGEINATDKQSHDFVVKNTGNQNLIIRKVKASCGCTAVTPAKTVLAKGEETTIHVEFNPSGKQGRQQKTITVITNDPDKSNVLLRISCSIKSPGSELR
ncbi:MAG: DUF1573 domain-containing protein [Bacteroidales bacterium]|nr:DUF1573 domain-containing protein [Bacteroidales bacterium]